VGHGDGPGTVGGKRACLSLGLPILILSGNQIHRPSRDGSRCSAIIRITRSRTAGSILFGMLHILLDLERCGSNLGRFIGPEVSGGR
jgi:hypothetical protein